MGWLMQVLSVRGAQKSASGSSSVLQTTRRRRTRRTPHFNGRTTPNFALPGARALIEGSARDPQPPTAIAPTGTKPRRSVVVARP